jgi:methionyl-tRNA formyltransferase
MKVICFCTLETGLMALKLALDLGVNVTRVIGLNPKFINDFDKVSGFIDISFFCKKNKLDYKYVDDYSLKTVNPNSVLLNTDIIWVIGWQRLLPSTFLEMPKIATIGSHGSCDGILKGRGRSPQNWALLMGEKKFKISLFKIDKSIDSGKVILTKEFRYENFDNILNSYAKIAFHIAIGFRQIIRNPILIERAKKQRGKPEYFPKRIPEDGFIDWNMSAVDIFNQIRSLSNPYPNARSIINGEKILINKASYIDHSFDKSHGKILYLFENRQILVSCGKGSLIIEDYQIKNKKFISIGHSFKSIQMKKTVKEIIKRFKKDFPKKSLNRSLLKFWHKKGLI